MPRAIWSGALSFGLVNVPVKVVTAVSQKEVRFNQLHEKDGGRVEMKRFCTAGDHEVPYDEIVKGFKIGGDEYVTMTKDEVEQLAPKKGETIDIEDFVDIAELDPIYFEKPYYLIPDKGGAKAYRLLHEAMEKSGRVAIARVVMRQREHLVVVRPIGEALTMTTLNYHDEIIPVDTLELPAKTKVPAKEIEMAEKLIDALTTSFDPEKYTDVFREQVLALIEAKAEGKEIVAPPAPKHEKKTKDLVDALQASLDAASKKRAHGSTRAHA
ncbi:MAG TPA: Ku protein [Candidatus Thermoplasmatota archaeon]|nr:Ku protein [Candidatus Thermoplasmatota archaeon]